MDRHSVSELRFRAGLLAGDGIEVDSATAPDEGYHQEPRPVTWAYEARSGSVLTVAGGKSEVEARHTLLRILTRADSNWRLSTEDVATTLGSSVDKVLRMVYGGKLKTETIESGDKKLRLYDPKEILDLARARRKRPDLAELYSAYATI